MRSPAGAQPPPGGLTEESGRRLAVLIDADNARAAVIEAVLEEVARFGEAIVRRIYGDFTSSHSASWKSFLNKFSIKPVQQFAFTVGKNATDSTMIIDAMDLLYSRRFDGFCLVTSDSDFTGLAVRLREEGLLVYGFGENKTPEPFRNACHKFLFTEVLRTASRQGDAGADDADDRRPREDAPPAGVHPVIPADFLMEALDRSVDDSGWAHLGTFGSYLQKIQPDFDTRLYGFRKLSDLVRGCPSLFEMEERGAPGGSKGSFTSAPGRTTEVGSCSTPCTSRSPATPGGRWPAWMAARPWRRRSPACGGERSPSGSSTSMCLMGTSA